MKGWVYGRLFGDAGYLAGLLVVLCGLMAPGIAGALCGLPACEAARAADTRCTGAYPGWSCSSCSVVAAGASISPPSPCTGPAFPNSTGVPVAAYLAQLWSTASNCNSTRDFKNYAICDCSAGGHPFATPSLGFKTDPDGSCDGGCKIKCTGTCTGVQIGANSNFQGQYGPSGEQCSLSAGAPDPSPRKPCDPLTGVCFDPTGGGPPKFCANGGEGPCVPSPRSPPEAPHGPDCGTDAHSAVCAGTPSNPNAPPPPPPDPPIPPRPDGQPPPPDATSGPFVTCRGAGCGPGSSGPVTINVNSDSGPGDANCPSGTVQVGSTCQPAPEPADPDNGGSGTGGGDGQLCPNGTQPVNGLCDAPHGTCPDGSEPSNGHCSGSPGTCADGSQPDSTGHCSGGGNCSSGAPPVNGECPWTCPGGSAPVNGQCQAPWGTCPDGSQPVSGTCHASACDPSTDANHCDDGHASGGGSCDAAPSCNGDQIACAQLYQQWSTRCAIEGLSPDLDNPETGHEGEQPDDTNVVHDVDGSGMLGQISESGFLGGGSCPSLPSFSVFGATFSFSDQPWWCDMLTVLAGIMLFVGAFIALQILME